MQFCHPDFSCTELLPKSSVLLSMSYYYVNKTVISKHTVMTVSLIFYFQAYLSLRGTIKAVCCTS